MATTTKGTAKVTLPSDDQILVTREFNAPRRLVYRAYTDPELVRRWWHADHGTMKVCEMDVRPGGTYRYAMDANNGFEVAFHGEYHEVVPEERIVATEVYEGAPDNPGLITITFSEVDGRTTFTMLMKYESQAVRDMVIASGMESGLQTALDLLEEVATETA